MGVLKNTRLTSFLYWATFTLILVVAVVLRLAIFDQVGGDWVTYKDAVNLFTSGKNPYEYTVNSFKTTGLDHGYAYFPTLLYILSIFWIVSNKFAHVIPSYVLWKFPVLICDLLVALFILKNARKTPPANNVLGLFLSAFWLLNPYLLARYEYSLFDPIFLLMLVIAINKADKNDLLAGIFFGLAVSLKTIPLIVAPLLFFNSKNKKRFLLGFFSIFILVFIPFLRSIDDFKYVLTGSILVHGERGVQGRPLLSYLTYYLYNLKVDFFQSEFSSVYAAGSLLLAGTVPVWLFIKKKLTNLYSLTLVSFLIYMVLSPVLSRSHLLWPLPFLLLSLAGNTGLTKKYLGLCLIYVVMFFYLFTWGSGIKPPAWFGQRPVLGKNKEPWEFTRLLRNKYYELRSDNNKLF